MRRGFFSVGRFFSFDIHDSNSKFLYCAHKKKKGNIEKYNYVVTGKSACEFNEIDYNCIILERVRDGSNRKTTYYLAEELDFMFLKITDEGDDWKNTLELKEILSFG